jgi:membrane protein
MFSQKGKLAFGKERKNTNFPPENGAEPMTDTPKPTLRKLIRIALLKYRDDDIATHAAALAFYTIFSLAPLLVVAVGVVAFVFGESAASGQLTDMLSKLMGREYADLLIGIVSQANIQPSRSVVAFVVGGVVLLFTSSTVIAQMKNTLNLIWRVDVETGKGLLHFIKSRLVSMSIVLTSAFLLLVSVIGDALLILIGTNVEKFIAVDPIFWGWVNYGGFISLLLFMFTVIYRVLPDIVIRWRDAFVGSVVTTMLFLLGRYAVSTYLLYGASLDAYGAAGSFLVLLFWIYYNTLIIFLGAELTHQYIVLWGDGYKPGKYARIVR